MSGSNDGGSGWDLRDEGSRRARERARGRRDIRLVDGREREPLALRRPRRRLGGPRGSAERPLGLRDDLRLRRAAHGRKWRSLRHSARRSTSPRRRSRGPPTSGRARTASPPRSEPDIPNATVAMAGDYSVTPSSAAARRPRHDDRGVVLGQTLTVTKIGAGAGTVTSSPPGVSCGSACVAPFPTGAVVTLTAVPDAGSAFAGWSGACTGVGACQVSTQVTEPWQRPSVLTEEHQGPGYCLRLPARAESTHSGRRTSFS